MSNEISLRLYNTLTGKVEPVYPKEPEHLRMYGCGPTVYSYAHIGNFRSFLTADLILRTARAIGWKTTYVTNITDVGHLVDDDTIDPGGEDRMARALRSKEGQRFPNVWDLARHYAQAFEYDARRLNLLEPDVRPRATDHIREQIQAIEKLMEIGAAYETSTAVYFSVRTFEDYGKLSGNRDAAQLMHAVREVVVDDEKRDPRDFALWKKDPHHLMQWHSPWGWGFPGWHIECSVMAQTYLSEEIDLHTGGEDLIFPHHECEIAQAESLTGKPFARHWVHTRFLQVEGQKMSKRLGNFLRVRDVLGKYKEEEFPFALRLALIAGHYRQPFNYTNKALSDAVDHVRRLREAFFKCANEAIDTKGSENRDLEVALRKQYQRALEAMKDDLNTPEAIAAALKGAKMIRTAEGRLGGRAAKAARKFLDDINELLGVIVPNPMNLQGSITAGVPRLSGRLSIGDDVEPVNPQTTITAGESGVSAPSSIGDDVGVEVHGLLVPKKVAGSIAPLIKARTKARTLKDWKRSDALRDEILGKIPFEAELRDTPEGTKLNRKITA